MAQLKLQETFDLAMQHLQAGSAGEAERLLRQVLARSPEHVDALRFLGLLAYQAHRCDDAIDLIRRAIALDPEYAEAHNDLGILLRNGLQLDSAIASFRRAVALDPQFAEALHNLCTTLRAHGQLESAIAAGRQSIALNPNAADAHSELGSALREMGRFTEAACAFRQALDLRPDDADAQCNLADTLKDEGKFHEAAKAYQQAISVNPRLARAYNNLGSVLIELEQLDAAIRAYGEAVALSPGYVDARTNLGSALYVKGQFVESVSAFRQAILINPNSAAAHNNLGAALRKLGQLDEAVAAHQQAIAIAPGFPEAHRSLGRALNDLGHADLAIAALRRAIALRPNYANAHSNLLLYLHYHPGFNEAAISREQSLWNRQHAEPLAQYFQPHANDRDPDRVLRIGYVSSDFRDHTVGYNLLALFRHHDKRRHKILCYALVGCPDAITAHFQQHADSWRSVSRWSDEHVANQIREDRIDILVDLALHTENNRLLVFARKPAPVQATFAGYPGSTGLTAIDYRLSDPYLDPPGIDESVYSEKTIRLPDSFWCYDPHVEPGIPINALPAMEKQGVITFGCLNNFCKVNDDLLALWAKVLGRIETSRMLILAPLGAHRSRTLERFEKEGINPGRVEFVANQNRQGYFETYHRIDLGLDTFPYNGHTTSLDSFWMGVPVVTLVGETPVSRAGWCQLSNLGLGELAAHTPEQFVQIAAALAGDLPRLQALRASLRRRMENSPLMDAPRFARNIEAAYRGMWRSYVGANSK